MAAPQQQQQYQPAQPAQAGPAAQQQQHDDVTEWTTRFNHALSQPGQHFASLPPASAQPWHHSFFACFEPVDTCFMAWCCPCIVFGRTHHRLRRSPSLAGYEPFNTSCLLFWASSCFALHWLPMAMQRADLRHKHGLQGDCAVDVATACCLPCCDLAQADKEAEYREQLLLQHGGGGGIQQGYQAQAGGGMAYPPQGQGVVAAPAPAAGVAGNSKAQ